MITLISSLVAGSKIIFTSLATTASATFSGMTSPNISTKNLLRSGCPSFNGRYIIGRVSPTAANENPAPVAFGVCATAVRTLATSGIEITGSAASDWSTRRRLGLLDGLVDGMIVNPLEGMTFACILGAYNLSRRAALTPLRQVKSLGIGLGCRTGSSPRQHETSDLTIYRGPSSGAMQLRHQKIGACMHRKYVFIGIQRWAIGMSLRKIAAGLAEAGHLNERGQPFNPKSIVAMAAQKT